MLVIDGTNGVIVNDGGVDRDFRVASDSQTHAFHIDGDTGVASIALDLNVGGGVKGNAGSRVVSIGTAGSVIGGLQLWSTTSGQSYVQFGDEAGTAANHYRGYVSYNHTGDILNLGASGATVAAVTSTGIAVTGVVTATGDIATTKTAGNSALISVAGNGNVKGTTDAVIAQDGGNNKMYVLNRANAPISFGANNTIDQMTLDASGNLTVATGNLVIGTSGKGIDFSATAGTGTSELLADYEEGTWTPVVQGSGTAGTYEQVVTRATYTKVGRQVTLQCYLSLASAVTGGGTGYLQITGAPFFALSPNQFPTTVLLTDMAKSATTLYVGVSWANTTSIYFPEVQPTAFLDFPIANAVANKTIQFTMTYFA